jgi:hypothetical protein
MRQRWAAKVDSTQPAIVEQLQAVGICVYDIRWPCDLLLRFWCNRHHDFCWQPLEIKTPCGKRRTVRQDPRQKAQQEFLTETNTPIAIDFDSAMAELNKRHALTVSIKPT